MSISLEQLEQAAQPEIATTIRNAGIAGAGGAGFPTYAKWERLNEVPFLMVNHQESEPNYYIDKWLGRTHAEAFAAFFDALLAGPLELVVVAAKEKDREEWTGALESATDATVYTSEDLPLDATEESGIVMAYTEDRYEYGMESVLMRIVADTVVRDELPMAHGWIVQNTETLFNIYRTIEGGEAMTHKFVHVDGNVPQHRFFEVPIGTPASELLERAGRDPGDVGDDEVLVDGGPGWCFEVDRPPAEFGVTKRTNCVQVLDEGVVDENTLGNGRVNVLNPLEWNTDHETEPTRIDPDAVRIPLITNPSLTGVVDRSRPIVEEGETVSAGEMVAVPASDDGISNVQHAPVDGTVSAVDDRTIAIARDETVRAGTAGAREETREDDPLVYWTSCRVCGAYVARPERAHLGRQGSYVCVDCR